MKDINGTYLCIASRLDSKRLPHKGVRIINNLPLIELLVIRLKAYFQANKIIICTSNEDINRPLIDISDRQSTNIYFGEKLDVMKRFLDAGSQYDDCETIVRITGDNPLTDPICMKNMIQSHLKNQADYTYTESIPRGLRSEVIDFQYLRNLHQRVDNPGLTEYMTYYLKSGSSKLNKFMPSIASNHLTFTVDDQHQLDFVNNIIKKTEGKIFCTTEDLIKTVVEEYGADFNNVPKQVSIDMSSFTLQANDS